MANFGIPEKIGEYNINIGRYSVYIKIYQMFTRMNRMDLIGARSTIGGDKITLGHDVTVVDEQGNIIDNKNELDEKYFTEYMESLYQKYMEINPEKLTENIYMFIRYGNGRRLTIPTGGVKIQKISDDFVKAIYFIDKYNVDIDKLISDLTNIGCTVKRLKDKNIRSYSCFALSILIPKQLSLSECRVKKLIRLTESDLHRIVKESVQKILKEHSK